MNWGNHLLVTGEVISLFTMVLIFFKVLIITPQCFSLLDGYLTILPLVFTKIVEIKIFLFS